MTERIQKIVSQESEDSETNAHLLEMEEVSVSTHLVDSRDIARYTRRMERKNQKKRNKNRKKGSLKPEGKLEGVFKVLQDIGDPASDEEKLSWIEEINLYFGKAQRFKADERILNVCVRMSTFMLGLSRARDTREVITLTLAVLGQYFDVGQLDQVFKWASEGLLPQGSSFVDKLQGIKHNVTRLVDLPCGKFLFNIFSLSVLSGYSAQEMVPFKDTARFIKRIELDIFEQASLKNYVECIFDVTEYVAMAFDAYGKGVSFMHFVFPHTLQQQIVDIEIMTGKIETGD